MVVFVSSPVSHYSILIKLDPTLIIRLFKHGTSFLVLLMADVAGFLYVSQTQLFLLPSMVTIIIAATRTYRSLIHSASPADM
jgi:hypothetical protein